MGVREELQREGYRFEYEHGDSEGRTEVWVNEKAGMAVRIEWMRMDAVAPRHGETAKRR